MAEKPTKGGLLCYIVYYNINMLISLRSNTVPSVGQPVYIALFHIYCTCNVKDCFSSFAAKEESVQNAEEQAPAQTSLTLYPVDEVEAKPSQCKMVTIRTYLGSVALQLLFNTWV